MKKFEIPDIYKSPIISRIKEYRKYNDSRKKDFKPAMLDFGPVRFLVARHFGFCYGVENAIEISARIIRENPDKRIFLLSEMIHNPSVNEELLSHGVRFITDTSGNQLIEWDELNNDDIVIIPAFGTTLEIENKLEKIGIDIRQYNTTCPFVEKVWNRSAQLGKENYTIIIHGKSYHEETRATFSHSRRNAPSLIVRNLEETKILGKTITGEITDEEFYQYFQNKYSQGFKVEDDLVKIGVVNQTTMLATETREIAGYLKNIMVKKYGRENIGNHFADTKDTLCYATYDNQESTYGLLKEKADFAVVVGGYNSSNTSHIAELCSAELPTYFISGPEKIISEKSISHFDVHEKIEKVTKDYLPLKKPVDIMLTSGASCPDSLVDGVLVKILSFFDDVRDVDDVVGEYSGEK